MDAPVVLVSPDSLLQRAAMEYLREAGVRTGT